MVDFFMGHAHNDENESRVDIKMCRSLKHERPQNDCVKVPQNAAKDIDISNISRGGGSCPRTPLAYSLRPSTALAIALDSKDGQFVVANFDPPFSKILYPPL